MQQLNALKTLKDPPHGWACGRLADLIGNGLLGLGQPCPQAIAEQAEDHDETERHNALGFLDKDGGGQKERIFEEAKAALGTALVLVDADQLLIGEASLLQDVRADNPAGFAEGFSFDLLLVDAHGCQDVPLGASRGTGFARTPLAGILRVSDEITVDVEPCGLLFQSSQGLGADISFTGKASVPQMLTLLLPGGLRFAHLSLQRLLGALERCLRIHDHPPFAPLWQRQSSAEPVDGSIRRLLPGLAAFLHDGL